MDYHDIAKRIMATILQHRRGMTQTCPSVGMCEACVNPHMQKITTSIRLGMPIQLLLLAFPCKSPNPAKVLGDLPDLAEVTCLHYMQTWTEAIRRVYPPGAEIIIGADGRAFADLVEVDDTTISAYISELRAVILGNNLAIRYIGIDDLLPDLGQKQDFDGLRAALTVNAEEELAKLRSSAKSDPNFAYQVNGIERFLRDDLGWTSPGLSNTKLKNKARTNAYGIIQRGNVLRRMLEEQFPGAIRLSVHPQQAHGGKLGVHIFPSRDEWMTPWHATALVHPDGLSLVKREVAQQAGANIVCFEDGRPSHYAIT